MLSDQYIKKPKACNKESWFKYQIQETTMKVK